MALMPFALGIGAITSIVRTAAFALGFGLVTWVGLGQILSLVTTRVTGALAGAGGEFGFILCHLQVSPSALVILSAFGVKIAMIPAKRYKLI